VSFDVFISYASKDKVIADAVCTRLEAAGIRCWVAPRETEMFRNTAPGKMRLRNPSRNLMRTLPETFYEAKPAKQVRNEILGKSCCRRAVWNRSVEARGGRVVTCKQNFCHLAVTDFMRAA
jgi:hypothetical protein